MPGLLDQLLDDAARQLHAVGEVEHRLAGLDMHEFEHQVEEVAFGDAGFGDRSGDRRRAVDDGRDLIRRRHAHRRQVPP